jgi:hypothetical protein
MVEIKHVEHLGTERFVAVAKRSSRLAPHQVVVGGGYGI